MAELKDLSDEIILAGLPILFLDTCILLDIIRCSTNRFVRGHAEAAAKLFRLASTTNRACHLVVSSDIQAEWDRNVQSVVDEANRYLSSIQEHSLQVHEACEALEIQVGVERIRYGEFGLLERLRDLSGDLLLAARSIDPKLENRDRAINRNINRIPPARTGEQVMDCLILEDYLALAQSIRHAGSEIKLVFCSSNTKDYCDPENRKRLKAHLLQEFSEMKLAFKANLPDAVFRICH
jgi:hypothetical protein